MNSTDLKQANCEFKVILEGSFSIFVVTVRTFFFISMSRREIREAGLTLIFDAKKTNPQPQLYKALMTFQVRTSA